MVEQSPALRTSQPPLVQHAPSQATPRPSHVPPRLVHDACVRARQLPLEKQHAAVGCGQVTWEQVTPSPWYVPPALVQLAVVIEAHVPSGLQQAPTPGVQLTP